MRSKLTRTIGLIVGTLAVLVGGVWIGQGAGLIKREFHDRQPDLVGHRAALPGCRTVPDLLGAATADQRRLARRSLAVRPLPSCSREAAARPIGFRRDRGRTRTTPRAGRRLRSPRLRVQPAPL